MSRTLISCLSEARKGAAAQFNFSASLSPVMETKHLSTGSTCPPQEVGVLRCYSMKFCPFAQRTRLILVAKNVKHDIVNVNLKTKPEWLFEKNPLGKVPALEKDGKMLFESLVTCDYLDEAYPDPPLYPSDPWQKAHDRVFMELWSKVTGPMYKVYFAKGDKEALAKAVEDIHAGLGLFETELKKRGTVFYGGEKPGMLDYMIWPWVERLPMAEMMAGDLKVFQQETFPRLSSWMEAMTQDKVVQATYLPPEAHFEYLTSVRNRMGMPPKL
ncbi:pyrimidodiazepine synthase-like isoform X2 [Penaeus indicus]|uniref:pyrimidodiazepine synthase-like isoform X2 n=1 Tax=Penaeus indicus TaxID=29960 RepID=UPI00300CC176